MIRCINGMADCQIPEPHEHVVGGKVMMLPRAAFGDNPARVAADLVAKAGLPVDEQEVERAAEIADAPAFEELVDRLIATAMDVGALRAPDGALKLTDQLTELRARVLRHLRCGRCHHPRHEPDACTVQYGKPGAETVRCPCLSGGEP